VNASSRKRNSNQKSANRKVAGRTANPVLPALLVVGGAAGLIAAPAAALELGQIKVDSSLGQPLRASIAYALSPNEQLFDYCISLNKGAADGLRELTRAKIALQGNRILLRGSVPIREPMLAMRMTVNCQYTAQLSRDYVLMINPPGATTANATNPLPVAASKPAAETTTRANRPVAAQSVPSQRRVASAGNESRIEAGSVYRVRTGDTLSEIASRISNRRISLWPAVDALFLANPEAFINGDKNRVKAGSLLTIPQMQTAAVAATIDESRALPSAAQTSTTTAGSSYEGYVATAEPELEIEAADPFAAAYEDNAATDFVDDTAILGSGENQAPQRAIELPPVEKLDNARPGDVFANSSLPDNAVVEITDTTSTAIPDTIISGGSGDSAVELQAPDLSAAATSPGNNAASESWSWLMWLGGAGIALILGLLLFGRKIRALFGGDGAVALPVALDADDEITQKSREISDVEFKINLTTLRGDRADQDSMSVTDFEVEEVSLDIDLGAGTGLPEGSDVDVVQDFGFAETAGDTSPIKFTTDELATMEANTPANTDIHANLEEGPASEESGIYDMSMIIDATKHTLTDSDATDKNLKAIQKTKDLVIQMEPSYTLTEEIDYKALEKDYEEEWSATQAINEEVVKAALELSNSMYVQDAFSEDKEAEMDDATVVMPSSSDKDSTAEHRNDLPEMDDATVVIASSSDNDSTAEHSNDLPEIAFAENDDFISDLDETGILEGPTAKMPSAEFLDEIEVEVESATINTKKRVG